MSGYGIENSYIEQFDFTVHSFLRQQGSALMLATTQEDVVGATKYIRQAHVGKAQDVIDQGGITEYTNVKYDRRLLKPTPFVCPLMLDGFDMIAQGVTDPGLLAQEMASSCGELIDTRIIRGLGGISFSEAKGEIPLPGANDIKVNGQAKEKVIAAYDTTQTIAWNDCTLGSNDNSVAVKAGLNASKIAKAVQMLKSKFNFGPIVCVASEYAMSTARADNRIACTDFNTQPSLASGYMTPYGGCNAFIPCQLVDGGLSAAKPADGTGDTDTVKNRTTKVEYAYIYAVNQIKLGWSMPMHLESSTNPERYMNPTMIYKGMCDCTRMFEEAVVRIEILKDLTGVKDAAFVI